LLNTPGYWHMCPFALEKKSMFYSSTTKVSPYDVAKI
jgi:hypothetical protein